MSNQPDTTKQNIIDWCKEDGILIEDNSSKFPNYEWLLLVDKNKIVFKTKRHPNRIFIQSSITITNNHQKIIADDQKMKFNMILQIPTMILQMGATCSIEQNDTTITKVSVSKIHFHSSMKKADFLANLFKVQDIHQNLLNQLSVKLQTTAKQLQQNQPAPAPDASDVGIG